MSELTDCPNVGLQARRAGFGPAQNNAFNRGYLLEVHVQWSVRESRVQQGLIVYYGGSDGPALSDWLAETPNWSWNTSTPVRQGRLRSG